MNLTEEAKIQSLKIKCYPQYLWLLILSFSMTISISNWFDARIIEVFGHAISPGALTFPATLLLSDIITEVYGYKQARRAIWVAFVFNFIFLLYGQLIVSLPSPAFATNNEAFDMILSLNIRIIAASMASYFISEPLNSYVMAKLKMMAQGKYMGLRFVSSTGLSALIDSVTFITIAFYGVFEAGHLFEMIINIWLIKVLIETSLIPISVKLVNFLKKKEKIDIYDLHTNFTPFSLDAEYNKEDNQYKEEK